MYLVSECVEHILSSGLACDVLRIPDEPPAGGLTVVFCGRWSGKPGPKSAAWRMPGKIRADDGGENPAFSCRSRTEHKGRRRRLRFTRPCGAWPYGFSVMWPQRRVRAVPCLHLSRAGVDARYASPLRSPGPPSRLP